MSEKQEDDATDRARANREASGWLILLQEEPDDTSLIEEFTHWLDKSPIHAEAWAETGRISQVIQTAPPAYEDHWRRALSNVVPFTPVTRRRFRVPRPVRRAGMFSAIAAAACLAVIAAPEVLLRFRADALSGTGETQIVHLQDGSVLTLAPRSAVAIDVAKGGARQVQLLRGRAWFEVAPDRAHPFRVAAADTITTVLGTGFEVQERGGGVTVAVGHGLVQVACDDRPGSADRLSVGDVLDLSCRAGGTGRRDTVQPSRIAPWVDGRIVVSDRPIDEVIDALRPWYGGIIVMRGNGFARRHVTGVYDARDPGQALRQLARTHQLSVRHLTPWITVVSAS